MRGERLLAAERVVAATPKEQTPRNSQVNVLSHVSTLESDTVVSTEGENWWTYEPARIGIRFKWSANQVTIVHDWKQLISQVPRQTGRIPTTGIHFWRVTRGLGQWKNDEPHFTIFILRMAPAWCLLPDGICLFNIRPVSRPPYSYQNCLLRCLITLDRYI